MRLDHTHDTRTRHSTNGSSSHALPTTHDVITANHPSHSNGSHPKRPTSPSSRSNSRSRSSSPTSPDRNGTGNGHSNGNGNGERNGNGHHPVRHSHSSLQRNTAPFHGHDREEVTRILLQSLSDLGYHRAARKLSQESGYALESESVAAFRHAVLGGRWEESEALLFGDSYDLEHVAGDDGDIGLDGEANALELDGDAYAGVSGDVGEEGDVSLQNGHSLSQFASHSLADAPDSWRSSRFGGGGHSQASSSHRRSLSLSLSRRRRRSGLPLAEGADVTMLRFALRQQKYLELLERRDLNAALNVLRNELTPLKRDVARLHALSSLIMCPSSEDLRQQADWDGAAGTSRTTLLSDISRSISPSVMIPEHRLATLFTAVQDSQILHCRYHNTHLPPTLYTDHACLADDFPLHPFTDLRAHADEVWHLQFSHDGSMLATAGKDGLVCVYDTSRWKVRHEFREHERSATGAGDRGVCCVAFSPDDHYLISCSQNNEFAVVDLRTGRCVSRADHFDYPVTSAAWLPDSQTFVVGTQGSQRPLGLYSLLPPTTSTSSTTPTGIIKNNEIHSFRSPPWDQTQKDPPPSFRITDLSISPSGSRLIATTIDNRILLYDLPSRARIAEWSMPDKLTSINFSADGKEVLVSVNGGRVVLIDVATGETTGRFEGVRQEEFVVRSCFGGAGEGFVVSGSEDSRVYIWRRQTGMQVAALEAHSPGTVNAVAWHPTNPGIFASAGDDRRVRIWAAASTIRPSSAISLETTLRTPSAGTTNGLEAELGGAVGRKLWPGT